MKPCAIPKEFTNSLSCWSCDIQFTQQQRRHHCRNCGESFCDKCCNHRHALPHIGYTTPVRCCKNCINVIFQPLLTDISNVRYNKINDDEDIPNRDDTNFIPFTEYFSSFNRVNSGLRYPESEGLYENLRDIIKSNDIKGLEYIQNNSERNISNHTDYFGHSLLYTACLLGNFSIISLLCQAGMNPYESDDKYEAPFYVALPSIQAKIRDQFPESTFYQNMHPSSSFSDTPTTKVFFDSLIEFDHERHCSTPQP